MSKLTIKFLPERQPKPIQKIYGESGELIKNQSVSDLTYAYSIDGKSYKGYQAFGVVGFVSAYSQILTECE